MSYAPDVADQFRRAVALRRPGDSMALALWRDGEPVDVVVSFPAAPQPEEQPSPS